MLSKLIGYRTYLCAGSYFLFHVALGCGLQTRLDPMAVAVIDALLLSGGACAMRAAIGAQVKA